MSRDAILRSVRAARPDAHPHPGTPDVGSRPKPEELAAAFRTALEAAGGQVAEGERGRKSARRKANKAVTGLEALMAERFPDARVASVLKDVSADVDPAAVPDPHDLADVDVLVCRAEVGVAENGAVWIAEDAVGQRAAPFLAQHVVVLLPRSAIVADLHEAYAAVDVAATGFGLFMAGPSKTADIEQSLVMGAHGPRSLTVWLEGGG